MAASAHAAARSAAPRHASSKVDGRGQIVDAVSIRERPAEAEDRAVPGHWEGDLLPARATATSRRWSSGTRAS